MNSANPERSPSRGHWWCFGFLLASVIFGMFVRVGGALHDPAFESGRVEGLLKSDPALLYYLTERVVDAGGRVPVDWHADPRIAHPETVDVSAEYTVGQEFLVAWLNSATGERFPLHILCVWLFGFVASLTALAVFGLTHELSGSRRWSGVATLAYLLLPANYRTLGFILIREDLSLPLFALHLYCTLRAARTDSVVLYVASALALVGALATWHAMMFAAAIEASVLLAWFVWSGHNPLRSKGARIAWALVALGMFAVPVLRAKGAYLAPHIAIGVGLVAVSRLGGAPLGRLIAPLVAALWIGLGVVFAAARDDFRHVAEVLWAKVANVGVLPTDPNELGFDARLLWQGPFATLSIEAAWLLFGGLLVLGLPLVVVALRSWFGAKPNPALALFAALTWAFVIGGLLVSRVTVFVGVLFPIVSAAAAARYLGPMLTRKLTERTRVLIGALFFAFIARHFAYWFATHDVSWYQPAVRQVEIAGLLDAAREHVPAGEAIATDFMNGPALLAAEGYPIVLQPKWETRASRERVERFWTAFYHGSVSDLHALISTEFECRYLVVDRFTLGVLNASRYVAGLLGTQLPEQSAARAFLSQSDSDLRSQPGFTLLWRSPGDALLPSGRPSDFFRLYRLDPLDSEAEEH